MTLPEGLLHRLDTLLDPDDTTRELAFPGPAAGRQPVHTAYVPADHFDAGTVRAWGDAALAALERCGPLPAPVADQADRVAAKLAREPVEDLRVDLEDGYGSRPDAEEDADARRAGSALAQLLGSGTGSGTGPPFCGLRMKSLERATRARGLRTLDLFLGALLAGAGGLPDGFRVTLPKVTSVAQVAAMVEVCAALEDAYEISGLGFEIQVETPQAVLGPDGRALVAPMVHAAAGRCRGLHYGTYDYSASLGIAAQQQSMEHPAADYAKAVMQVAAAGTGVPVCEGSTNVLPVGSVEQVRAAWSLHARLVRRSLERGYYQGWDLHPAQLPTRYAATFGYFRDGAAMVGERLRAYVTREDSGVLDEPATAAAMASFLARGLDAGALYESEVHARCGFGRDQLLVLARRAPAAT